MLKRYSKTFVLFLVFVMAVVTLAGCTGGDAEKQGNGDEEKPKEWRINVATATTGGAYYPIGNSLAQIWSKNVPGVRAAAQATAGTPQNVELMVNGEADVGIGQSGICYYAYSGTGTFEGKAEPSIRGLLGLYPNVVHMIMRKGSGLEKTADIEGKRFVPGQVASATEVNSREILKVYGLNYMPDEGEVNVEADFVGYNEAVDLMKDGHIDATMIIGGLPTAAVLDVLATNVGEIVSLEEDKIEEICAEYPWYYPIEIPAGTYTNQDEVIKTIAVANILFVPEDMDEDLVYSLAEAVYEYHDDLVAGHKATEYTTIENAMYGMIIPLHPGAVRFFEDQGVDLSNVPQG